MLRVIRRLSEEACKEACIDASSHALNRDSNLFRRGLEWRQYSMSARPLPRPPPGKHKGFNASIFKNVPTWARSNYDLP